MAIAEAAPMMTQDVARALNVGPQRVRQLEALGLLTTIRTPSGFRIFDAEQVEALRRARELKKGRI